MHDRVAQVIDRVQEILERAGVRYAVIGGIAVIARGFARVTIDVDFFTTDKRVLQPALWDGLSGVPIDIRKGDFDDPLGGVVRIGSAPDLIDVVVGKNKWENAVIERAETLHIKGLMLPVPLTSDLILLKLAAGGPIDRQDIIRLLEIGPRDRLIADVQAHIGDLPQDAQLLWKKLLSETA
jgi:predicted nucleotidyltransferase